MPYGNVNGEWGGDPGGADDPWGAENGGVGGDSFTPSAPSPDTPAPTHCPGGG